MINLNVFRKRYYRVVVAENQEELESAICEALNQEHTGRSTELAGGVNITFSGNRWLYSQAILTLEAHDEFIKRQNSNNQ